ncbi:NEDD8-activating enzyme E1 regulatory subunit-like [Watersipora subatra]|uniref:NEDD8-activating enzyme E1 regulatory subunit-like n=1 Tax=Watersipora subatra TaxID=2589382 RepID=UPI00355BFC20
MNTPSEKTQKYDRQLRLWGENGQALLESCSLCLINATATGCETLKNLILPGIGSFAIIDDHNITEEDLGNNFFVTQDSVGKKRGLVVTEYLTELNDDVRGEFIDENLEGLFKRSPESFLQYTVVIITALPKQILLALTKYLWVHDIPVVICRSYGMLGYLRLVVKDHTVVEAHPEYPHPDLRLTHPFSELVQHCDEQNLEKLSKKDHAHVPWLIILYKSLQIYRTQHDGQLPKTYKDKKILKSIIEQGKRTNEDGVPEEEENFDEAVKAVNTALTDPSLIPSSLKLVLEHPNVAEGSKETGRFWILARALRDFINTYGQLPLQGTIPDMTADSESYISLQKIYRNKAAEHVRLVHKLANETQECLEAHKSQQPSEELSLEETRLFCRNAGNIAVVNCRSLNAEYDSLNTSALDGRFSDEGEDDSVYYILLRACEDFFAEYNRYPYGRFSDEGEDDSVYYILLRACEDFFAEYNRYPGCYDDQVEADITPLKAIASRLIADAGLNVNIREDCIHELCSYGASELHSVAAFMGGVAAQEVIKLITKQYLPINNTYIYNASSQTSLTLEL